MFQGLQHVPALPHHTPVAPKSVRIQSSYQYFFTLLGSTGAKAARRMLMKLTPDDRDEPDNVAAADKPGANAAASLASGSSTSDSTASFTATAVDVKAAEVRAPSDGYKTRQNLAVTKSKSSSVEASPNKRRKDGSDHSKDD